ncbi:MAG: hypothetical protein ACK4S0_13330 [Sediminibacterium sp.]
MQKISGGRRVLPVVSEEEGFLLQEMCSETMYDVAQGAPQPLQEAADAGAQEMSPQHVPVVDEGHPLSGGQSMEALGQGRAHEVRPLGPCFTVCSLECGAADSLADRHRNNPIRMLNMLYKIRC